MSKIRVSIFLGDKQVSAIDHHLEKEDAVKYWDAELSSALETNCPIHFEFSGKTTLLNPNNILCILVEEVEEEDTDE